MACRSINLMILLKIRKRKQIPHTSETSPHCEESGSGHVRVLCLNVKDRKKCWHPLQHLKVEGPFFLLSCQRHSEQHSGPPKCLLFGKHVSARSRDHIGVTARERGQQVKEEWLNTQKHTLALYYISHKHLLASLLEFTKHNGLDMGRRRSSL